MTSKTNEIAISDDNSADYEIVEKPEINNDLPLWRRLAFGVGEVVDLPAKHLSIILFTSRAIDAFTDPIMGYLVLKTRSRFGQKRPWMIFSTPVWAISFFFLYYAFEGSPEAKLGMYLITNCLIQIGLTAYHVPFSSMTMVLTVNPKERDVLTAFRMFSETVAIFLGVAVFGSIISPYRTVASCEEMNIGTRPNFTTLSPSSAAGDAEDQIVQ
ncbi:hypothetical protein ACTXT7_016261 [Hymenolepis weldensis]